MGYLIDMAERRGISPQIACEVSGGLFSNERCVEVTLPDGTTFSANVDKSQVSYSGDLNVDESVGGLLNVRVVESTPKTVYIDLPGQDIVKGSRVEVPKDFLQFEA